MDPDQDQQDVGVDLDPTIWHSDCVPERIFFWKLILKKCPQTTKAWKISQYGAFMPIWWVQYNKVSCASSYTLNSLPQGRIKDFSKGGGDHNTKTCGVRFADLSHFS